MKLTKGQIMMIQNMVNTELSNKNTVYNPTELVKLKEQLTLYNVVVPKGTFACHEELAGRQKCDSQCSRIDCHYLNQEAS